MNPNLSAKLSLTTAAVLFLGAFAAAAFAGPGPQYWNRQSASTKTDQPAATTAACSACKTTDTRAVTQHGPAGKGTTESTTVGTKHECSMCAGTITTAQSGSTDTMVRGAAMCGPKLCYVSTTK